MQCNKKARPCHCGDREAGATSKVQNDTVKGSFTFRSLVEF